jgi:hypothetical protein
MVSGGNFMLSPPKPISRCFFASLLRPSMKGVKKKGQEQLSASKLVILRAWQKKSKNKRCTQVALAAKLSCSVATLRGILNARSLPSRLSSARASDGIRAAKGTAKKRLGELPADLRGARSYRAACRDTAAVRNREHRARRAKARKNRVRPEEHAVFASQTSKVEAHARRLGW